MINADKEEEKEKEGESESERHGGWGTPCVEMEIGRGGKRASASSTRGLCVCVFCLKTVKIHLGGVWCSVQFDLSFQKRHRPRRTRGPRDTAWGDTDAACPRPRGAARDDRAGAEAAAARPAVAAAAAAAVLRRPSKSPQTEERPVSPPSGAAAGVLRQLTCCCISGATVSTIYDKLARM